MLNEKEAWLKIAEIFSGEPKEAIASRHYYLPEDKKEHIRIRGICVCLNALEYFELVSDNDISNMRDTMDLYAERNSLDTEEHYWPLTPEGDKERVKFCKEQAEKCSL